MLRVPPEEFEALVKRALDLLPEEFAQLLDNVAVVVEDEPDPDVLREFGFDPGEELFRVHDPVGKRGPAIRHRERTPLLPVEKTPFAAGPRQPGRFPSQPASFRTAASAAS